MRVFPSEREVRRAEARMGRRVFGAMAIVTLWFGVVVGVHYLLGWW
jgi:hypothetical protein